MLIPLQGEQAEKSPFPPTARVNIYREDRDAYHSIFCGTGVVTGSLLQVKGTNSCQIISKVQVNNNSYHEGDDNDVTRKDGFEQICQSSELRLSAGCPVTVKQATDEEGQGKDSNIDRLEGVILGTVDVPEEMKQYAINEFWYSVYLPSLDTIKHEVMPDQVAFRHAGEGGKEKQEVKLDTNNMQDIEPTKPKPERKDIQRQLSQESKQGDIENSKYRTVVKDDIRENQDKMGEKTTPKIQVNDRKRDYLGQAIKADPDYAFIETKSSFSSFSSKEIGFELFVGNIPSPPMTDKDLGGMLDVFGPIGNVKMLRNCAKVRFKYKSSAEKCIAEMHNQVVIGNNYLPMRIMPSGVFRDDEYKLLVQNLPPDIHPEAVWKLLEKYGEIIKIFLIRDEFGRPVGAAIVLFKSVHDVVNAHDAFNAHTETMQGCDHSVTVVIPDNKTHKRQLADAEDSLPKNMNDSVATETTELGSIPPTVVYATPKREEEVMASRTQIHNTKNNNMPNNQKRMRPNVNGENSLALGKPQSPGRVMHVANLRIPLPRSMVTGSIIGHRGSTHKELMRETSCKIVAIEDANINHCVEVSSGNKCLAEEGVNHIIKHVFKELGHLVHDQKLNHMISDDIKQQCCVDWTEASFHDSPRPFSTRLLPSKAHSENDSIWRLYIPHPKYTFRDFVIGKNGARHQELMMEFGCKMILLRDDIDMRRQHCTIEIVDSNKIIARDGIHRLLQMLRNEFGHLMQTAHIQRVN